MQILVLLNDLYEIIERNPPHQSPELDDCREYIQNFEDYVDLLAKKDGKQSETNVKLKSFYKRCKSLLKYLKYKKKYLNLRQKMKVNQTVYN